MTTWTDILHTVTSRWHTCRVPGRIRGPWEQYLARRRAERWQRACRRCGTLLHSLPGGLRMKLYTDSELCRLIYTRNFEGDTRQFLCSFLRPGDVFVDVGANIGLLTLIAAQAVGPSGRVYAFEPSRPTFRRLTDNVARNGLANVACHRLALSDRIGQAELTVSRDGFDAWNSLAAPYMGKELHSEDVPTTTWDAFAQQHGLSNAVTLMKIDVEGWEAHVLQGGRKHLTAHTAPLLLVEFTEAAARNAGSSCQALYTLLEDMGYRLYPITTNPDSLIRFPLTEPFPQVNLLAVPANERLRKRLFTRRDNGA